MDRTGDVAESEEGGGHRVIGSSGQRREAICINLIMVFVFRSPIVRNRMNLFATIYSERVFSCPHA